MRMLEGFTSIGSGPRDEHLRVTVEDLPGSGGAHHRYRIEGMNLAANPSHAVTDHMSHAVVLFQQGPIGEKGANGVTHEALLAILIDRLECFQNGKFANRYNAMALEHLRGAQQALLARTKDRQEQGIEGTHIVGRESEPATNMPSDGAHDAIPTNGANEADGARE
jgi:hypothetical protein